MRAILKWIQISVGEQIAFIQLWQPHTSENNAALDIYSWVRVAQIQT